MTGSTGSLYRNRPSVGSFDGIARLRVGPFARSTTLKLRVTKPGYTTTTISDRIHVHH